MSSKSNKSKIIGFPGDLIALGSKPTRSSADASAETKKISGTSSPSTSSLGACSGLPKTGSFSNFEKKWEADPIAKKLKTSHSTSSFSQGDKSRHDAWEEMAADVSPVDFLSAVNDAELDIDEERVESLICGCVKSLRSSKSKSEGILTLQILYLAKNRPSYFFTEFATEAICSLLRNKHKVSTQVVLTAVSVLQMAYEKEKSWPESFMKYYIEDAVNDRVWVDRPECKPFVKNLITAFGTKSATRSLAQQDPIVGITRSELSSSPNPAALELRDDFDGSNDTPVIPRFVGLEDSIEKRVIEVIQEQLSRRQDTISKSFLKFLSAACGLPQVRAFTSQRLEMWLMNPKLLPASHELFLSLCANCVTQSPIDAEVVSQVLKLRIKSKAITSVYYAAIKELIDAEPGNLRVVLRHTIYNELSTARNTNNMAILGVIFQHNSSSSSVILAEVFQEFLLNRDDYLRSIRALYREILRSVKQDFEVQAFTAALLSERADDLFLLCESKDRYFMSLAELITLSLFVLISSPVKEEYLSQTGAEGEALAAFHRVAGAVQQHAVHWLTEKSVKHFKVGPQEFGHFLHKVLFLDSMEQYCLKDMWTNESEKTVLLRIASEIPPSEDTVVRVLVCGLAKEFPLVPADALDVVDQLVKRALLVQTQRGDEKYGLKFDETFGNVIELILKLTMYKHPENIALPIGYEPPRLAITTHYWKAWSILMILVCMNPATLGAIGWEQYPTLRVFMEMCITHNFQWPPPIAESGEEVQRKELQTSSAEKAMILEFEGHLAAGSTKESITENNSRLLFQLITFEPSGRCRKPSSAFLDQLSSLNTTFQLGSLLSRSRKPDFLLDILRRQGSVQSFAWLSNLIRTNEGALSLLPVQCLCEFLLHECQQDSSSPDLPAVLDRHKNLILYLRSFLWGEDVDTTSMQEVAEYFLRKVYSPQTSPRKNAFKALKLMLVPANDLDYELYCRAEVNSVLSAFPKLPRFEVIRGITMNAFAQACLVETEAGHIVSYLEFLAGFHDFEDLEKFGEMIVDLSQLLVERGTMLTAVITRHKHGLRAIDFLTSLFLTYTDRISTNLRPLYAWGSDSDQIFVRFPNGQATTLSILVVHAVAILLAFGPGATHHLFSQLLDFWFPETGELPQGFVLNSTEEAILFPDWLKLKMIRSSNQRLVDAALRDLQPSQLILFIQSFGIPVVSMSKMLSILDQIVSADPFAFVDVDMDRPYISQLLFVQWQRGAVGGAKFADILQMRDTPIPGDGMFPKIENVHMIQLNVPEPMETEVTDRVENVPKLLLQIFDYGSVIRYGTKDKDESHRLLLKDLSSEAKSTEGYFPVTGATVVFLHKALCSFGGEKFIAAIQHQLTYFSSIMRSLTDSVVTRMNDKCYAPLIEICITMLINRAQLNPVAVYAVEQTLKRIQPLMKTRFTLPPGLLTPYTNQQDVLTALAKPYLKSGNTRSFVTDVLSQPEKLRQIFRSDFHPSLVVDLLETLEPEILTDSMELKLFSKEMHEFKSFQSSLLTLIVHRSSWRTIRRVVGQALESDGNDPMTVLEFLQACVTSPRLVQGRDKHIPKHAKRRDFLKLKPAQIAVLISLVRQAVSGSPSGCGVPANIREMIQTFVKPSVEDLPVDSLEQTLRKSLRLTDRLEEVDERVLNVLEALGTTHLLSKPKPVYSVKRLTANRSASALHARLAASSTNEETLQVLQDLNRVSQGQPGILLGLVNDLKYTLASSSRQVKTLAISLILRALSEDQEGLQNLSPALARYCSPAEISTALLEKLPDLVGVLKSDAKPLLMSVYDLAIRGALQALPALQDSSL